MNYKQLKEALRKPIAVWVVGGAASGKSTVADVALIRGLKFKLIDPDEPFEKILKQYNLGTEIEQESPEEKKRKAELKKQGKLTTVSMGDLADPMDYFKVKKPTVNGAAAVGREITKRNKESAIAQRDNIAFVETGALVGQIRNMKKRLEDLGYITLVAYVGPNAKADLSNSKNFEATLDVIMQRSSKRAGSGGRKLDDAILRKSLSSQSKVKKELLPLFGRNVLYLDTLKSSVKRNATDLRKMVRKFL